MALRDQKGISETIMNKNRIKQLIKEYFGNKTDCCAMIKPFQEGSTSAMRPEFKQQLDGFKQLVKQSEPHNFIKNGKILIHILQECVDALNGNRFPKLKSTWDYIVAEENQKLMNDILSLYD